jgi:predicted nucleotide-binding protein
MKLGLRPIILAEEPNAGRTIIEKLEASSSVGFAAVLLTPDDVGATKDNSNSLKPRARQNVILELGYFVAKLGRERVCALYRAGVELPSDYHGVAYVVLDDQGAWKLAFAREMKASGINVDLNLAG